LDGLGLYKNVVYRQILIAKLQFFDSRVRMPDMKLVQQVPPTLQLIGLAFLGCLFFTGCQASRYAERFGLGTIDKQKAKAADFDPYPLNDIGPSVVGGRPPGFFNPLPEPRRNELMGRNAGR
jgi:hypothetical protein